MILSAISTPSVRLKQSPAPSPLLFQGKLSFPRCQRLHEEEPLISIDFPQTPKEFNTQPGLLIQLLSDGRLNFCNSNARAAIPEIGPWVMHLQTDEAPCETRTSAPSLVLSQAELAETFRRFPTLKIWFTHPRIDGYQSPVVEVKRMTGQNEFQVIQTVTPLTGG